MYPTWYENYERLAWKRLRDQPDLIERYKPSYQKVCKTIHDSFRDHDLIDKVLHRELAKSHPLISEVALSTVYVHGWNHDEGTRLLRTLLETLINEPIKHFNESDYL